MSHRIKGQETEVLLISGGQVIDTLTDIRSCELTTQLEIKTEGYLGEKTNRRDEVFNGTTGNLEAHYEDKATFDLLKSLIDRAKRRTPTLQVNLKTTLNFPNGQRQRVLLEDLYFGNVPLGFPARGEYNTIRLDFESANQLQFL